MKNPGICRMRRWLNHNGGRLIVTAMLLFFCTCGIAAASESATAEGGTHGEAVAEHGEAAASHGEGSHGSAAVKGWADTDTYRVFNFAVLAIALFMVLRKPASNALNGRIERIKEQLSDLESKKVKAETELAEYNRKLAELDEEVKKIVAAYEEQGEEARERILREAEAAAEKLKEQARKNIDYEFNQAKLKLQADILEKAMVKAEDILKAKITHEDQNRLVDEYLEKVVA